MPNDNLAQMLQALLAKAQFDARNRKAFESRSGKMDKWARQGMIAGTAGTAARGIESIGAQLMGGGRGDTPSLDSQSSALFDSGDTSYTPPPRTIDFWTGLPRR